jgi:hypothetical protein
MSYELEVNLPNVPKGQVVEVTGLGTYENGTTSPIPDNLRVLWQMNNPYVDDAGQSNPGDLTKANFQEGIKVHKAKAGKKEADDNKDDSKEGGK